MSQQDWKNQETTRKNPDQQKNNHSSKYLNVFPSRVSSSVGGKIFTKVTVKNLNRAKEDNQQEAQVQALKSYKLLNLGFIGVPKGPTFDVDPIGSKRSTSSKVSKHAT